MIVECSKLIPGMLVYWGLTAGRVTSVEWRKRSAAVTVRTPWGDNLCYVSSNWKFVLVEEDPATAILLERGR